MKFHNTLNPKLWDKWQEKHIGGKITYHLKKDVAAKLKEIANAFIEYLEVDKEAIKDVVITGSSASFNYTSHSDLDLHLKVDYDLIHEDCPIVEGYLWALKSTFNKDHDISIYGIPVEVYAESIDSDTVHNGLFSLWNMKWIDEPKPIPPTDNDMAVKAKYEEIKEAADRVKDSEVAEQLINKIYEMRKAGLQEVGEFSTENLAFKKLRDAGVLERLKAMKKEKVDKQLSLESYKESVDSIVIDNYLKMLRDGGHLLDVPGCKYLVEVFTNKELQSLIEFNDVRKASEKFIEFTDIYTNDEDVVLFKQMRDNGKDIKTIDSTWLNVSNKNESIRESQEELIKEANKITNHGMLYMPVRKLAAKLMDTVKGTSDEEALKVAKMFFKETKNESIKENSEILKSLTKDEEGKLRRYIIKEYLNPILSRYIDNISYFMFDFNTFTNKLLINLGFSDPLRSKNNGDKLIEELKSLGLRQVKLRIKSDLMISAIVKKELIQKFADFILNERSKNESINKLEETLKKAQDKELSLESYNESDNDLTNFCIIIDGDYNWLEEYGTFKSCKAAQEWLDRNGEEDWMYSQLTKGEMKDLGIDEFGYVNESIKEYYEEDDCEDIPEEMHKERYVTYFETREGRQKYTTYHVYTDSTDDSYNELCDKRDNQLGMYNSYKELKDALKERAEKIATKQGWTVKSIENLGEDDEYYRERNKLESLKESLKDEYKQAFDLLIKGENIVGTLDTDFGKQFVKDVESLYEIKSSKLKLRKAKELLKDLQGYLVDEQYDDYNSKIDKFMNNSKNESIDTDLLKRDERFRYMMLDRMRQDCNYYLEHPHEKHLWAGNVEDQIETMKQLYNSLPEKPEWITMEDIDDLQKQMINLKNNKNEDVNTLCDKIDNVEKDLEDMVKLVKPQVLMKNEAYNKLRKVVCEALEETEFGEFKVGSKVKIGNTWNARQGTITDITNDVATVEIEETPDNMARTDKFYLQDLQLA